jgi:hypothetical protein
MQLGKPVRYLFFAIMNLHTETSAAGNLAILPTVGVTSLLSLNILVVIQGLMFFGMSTPLLRAFPNAARVLGYSCYILVGGIVWASFVQNGKYKRFEAEFATTSERRKKMRTTALALYIVLSVCLPFIGKVLLHNVRH